MTDVGRRRGRACGRGAMPWALLGLSGVVGVLVLLVVVVVLGVAPAQARSGARVRRVDYPPPLLVKGQRFRVKFNTVGTGTALVKFKLALEGRSGPEVSVNNVQVAAGQGKQVAPLEIPKSTAPDVYDLVACINKQCVTAGTPIMVWTGQWSTRRGVGAVAKLVLGRGAETKMIGPGGGRLSATDARGNHFRLVIPTGAVAVPTAITMTPLSSISGQPAATGFKAGIELAPAGTVLYQPAKLTITTAHEVPWAGRSLVAATDTGGDLHVDTSPPDEGGSTPQQTNSEPTTDTVTDLGTDALTSPPAADVGAQQDAVPPDPASQVTAQIAQILDDARQQIRDTNDPSQAPAIENAHIAEAQKLASEYLDKVVNDELGSQNAQNNDNAAQQAIKDALEWARDAELLGADANATDAKVFPAIVKVMRSAYNRAQKRCADNHDLTEIGDNIIPDARQLQLLGEPEIGFGELFKCAHFRVVIDSNVTEVDTDAPGNGSYQYHYQATVPVTFDPSAFPLKWTGSGAGAYAKATGSVKSTSDDGGGCTTTQTTTLTSGRGNHTYVLDFAFPTSSTATDKSITLTLGSSASENYQDQMDSCGSVSSFSETATHWWPDFSNDRLAAGDAKINDLSNNVSITMPLHPGPGEIFAQKSYSYTQPPGSIQASDQSTITVIHTPR